METLYLRGTRIKDGTWKLYTHQNCGVSNEMEFWEAFGAIKRNKHILEAAWKTNHL